MSDSSDSEGSYSSSSYDGDSDDDGSGVPLPEVNIQDVIRDRKTERTLKAEEKRQADLQRIREMRSTTGIDPLQRFPKEIWLKILDELDPEDRGNVWHVHPLFRDLLEETRIRDILFPQVIKVPAFRTSCRRSRLRSISKSTRNSFDQFVEHGLTKDIHEAQAESNSNDDLLANIYFSEINGRLLLQRLLNSFGSGDGPPGKRFFPRALTLSFAETDMEMEIGDDIVELFNQHKDNLTTLLKAIGDQIWQFRFFVDLETITLTFLDMYNLFQGWACLMPNLKWLELEIPPSSQVIGEFNEKFLEAKSTVQKHPFPRMHHLERLSFHSGFRHPRENGTFLNIYQIILEANQHIKMLDIIEDEVATQETHVPASLTQSLNLNWFTVCDEDYSLRGSISTLSSIKPIVNYNWPLKTIRLSLFCGSDDGVSITSVFRFLEHFPILEKVKLFLLWFRVEDTDKFGYLKLPNLKEFDIELKKPEINYDSNIHFFFSLQFLLECKNLQRISWALRGRGYENFKLRGHLRKREKENYGKMVDFRAGLRYLYDSNIWNVFPALESLNVCNEDRSYIPDCHHEFKRTKIENMSVGRFLREHNCSRYDHLDTCVILVY